MRLLNPVGGAALGARAVTLVNIADNDTALPPEITVQPVNTVTEVNQSATFSVTARGSAPRTFQWRRNGANLPGQTSRTLTLNNVQPADAAIYSVKVSNPFGDTFSADVSLGVLPVGGQQFYTISEYVPAGTGLLRPGDTVSSMALDRNGDLYITTRNCIVKIAPDRVMTRIAGQLDTYGYANGQGEAAQFALPRLVLTSTGDFVVGDYNGVLRRVTKDGLVSPPFVGVAGSFASTDGTGEGGRFGGVVQVATDVADNIYFLDFPVNSFYPDYIGTKLRKVTPTGVLTTIPFTLDATVQLSPFSTGTITTSGFARDERGRFFVANFVGYPAFGGGLSFVIYTTALITEGVGTALQLLDGQFALRFHRLGNYVVAVDTSGRFQLISPYGLVSYLRRPDGNQIAVGVSANYGAGVHISDDGAGSFFYSDGSAIFKASPAAAYVAPEITLQPSSLGATAGATVNFDVTAYGTGPLTYQWRKGGTALTGQTSARLTLASVTLADAGSYDCFIQGPGGSIYSDAASLFLRPALTTAPQPVSVSEGQPAQFTAAAAGFPAPAYQWLKNGTPLPGQTGATLAFASAQPADVGFYAVAVTNIAGGITSAPVQLTVGILPTVDTPPAHQTLTNGALNLAVAASGPGPLTYQWRRNGVDLPGATTATFTLPAPTTADAGRYTVVVGNAAGTRESVAADVEFFGDLKFYSGTVIAGPIGKTYRVEHTPSLSGTPVWTLLRNVTLPFSPYLVIDENSPGVGKRFYRAVPLP